MGAVSDVPSAGLAFLADVLFAALELAFLGEVSFAAGVLGFVLLGIAVLLGSAHVSGGVIRPLPLDQHEPPLVPRRPQRRTRSTPPSSVGWSVSE